MANVLGLALKITGDASGLRLDPAQRALQRLGDETDKVSAIFDRFTGDSEAAGRAQAEFERKSRELLNTLRDGGSATEFAANFERIAEAARAEAAALQEAARITESVRTPFERFQQQANTLASQLEAGRITQETYNRAIEQASKGLTDAERAAAGLSVQTKDIATAGDAAKLQFNELSGIFAILPGPLGNIAGRLSGITSASEGLSRVFSGGLSQGITSIANSVTSLVNPFTVAAGAIIGVGAAASSVTRGLISLEDRVERLGNQAAQLGVSFEFIQTLEESARRSGVSVGSLEGAFTRLQRTITEAGEGTKTATDAISTLGLTVEQLDTLDQQEQFRLIGERISQIEDPARRTAAAVEVFGRSGAQLLPFFRNLGPAADDIERLGGAITQEERQQIDELGASFDALNRGLIRLGEVTLVPFVGIVSGVVDSLAGFIGVVNRVARVVGTVLAPVLNSAGLVFEALGGFATVFNEGFDLLFGSATQAAEATNSGVKALREEAQKPLRTGIGADLRDVLGDVNELLGGSRSLVRELAGEFGERAYGAADILRREVARLQRQLEQASTSAERSRITSAINSATDRYRIQIDVIRRAAQEREQQIAKERGIADELVNQLRIQDQFGTNDRRARAAEAVLAINREIIRTESSIDQIRRREGERAADAAQQRIADLQRALVIQQQIASGFTEQAEADRERINALLQATQQRSDAEDNILALQREQQRILDEQSAAVFRGGDAFEQTIAATQDRLNQLAQLLQRQENLRDAQALGFVNGFDEAFQKTAESIDALAVKAAEFGEAGIAAAARLQEGIAAAQEQARDGILNREAFEAEVRRREQLFAQEIEQVQAVAEERQRVNELVDQQFALARFGGDQQRLEAANRVADLEREIIRVQQEVQTARAAGDQAAVNAGITRLGQLDQVAAKERDVATGRQQFEEQIAQQREQYLQQIAEQQKQAEEQQKKFAEERAKAVEAENQRQAQRLRELNTLGSGVIEGNDIRTAEGAALFLQLAANRQDPALIEARLQTKRLGEIRQEIRYIVESLQNLPLLQLGGGIG